VKRHKVVIGIAVGALALLAVFFASLPASSPVIPPSPAILPTFATGRPTTAPLPTPTPPPNPAEVVQQQLDKLSQGEIAFNPPSRLKIGDKARVEARIARQSGTSDLTTGIQGPGAPQVQPISTSTFMGAELTGDGFEIKELSNRNQVVQLDKPSEWAWDIKATKLGRQALHLHVWVRIVAPPVPEQVKDLPVLDQDVDVQVNPAYSIGQFWETNWQWVLGSGFSASVLAAAWKIRTRVAQVFTAPPGGRKKRRRHGSAHR
jgi:hypothetical protein